MKRPIGNNNPLHLPTSDSTGAPVGRAIRRMLGPVERFLAIEAASGIILLITALVALIWANSPWRSMYESLWHIPIGMRLGVFSFERELHFWVNDGLMTIFFFVVGLEIRREIHGGELSGFRRAALPLAAAFGGMVFPAIIYLGLNFGRSSAVGWAVPMATDIAFAVGVLALLGNRVAPALRILLLALAVIDDVGAIVVIAAFYSSGLVASGFMVAAVGVVAIILMQAVGVRSPLAYVAPAVCIWAGAYAGGVHPTLAGVIVGMMTPARPWFGADQFLDHTEARVQAFRAADSSEEHALLPHINAIGAVGRETVSPVERLQSALHGWVAFGIMPLFALANAGVPLGNASFEDDSLRVFLGVTAGLIVGKPIGIVMLSWIATRLGIATLPTGMRWRHILVVGMVGGVGFTMSLFIGQLAFSPGSVLETTKFAILAGSVVAAALSFVAGHYLLGVVPEASAAVSETEAESSTDA